MSTIFVMVGLPARGKTFMSRKIARYLSWLGHATRVFNVGSYRRERLGAHQRHEFFAADNQEASTQRRLLALAALDDLLTWCAKGGEIAIYDATNSTIERRSLVRARCQAAGHEVVFVESVCNDAAIVDANVRETKARSPDYVGVDATTAVRDFRARIAHYEEAYESVEEFEGSFVKVIDVGRKVIAHRIEGPIPSRIVFFLLNLHIHPRALWLTRHGESEFNVQRRIGGDSPLTAQGTHYAEALREFLDSHVAPHGQSLTIWTSTLRRTVQTAERLGRPFTPKRALDEIDAGECDGLTYEEISERLPQEFAARKADKFRYRYPRGESYEDVIRRLEPVILELERERVPVVVVGHQAVLRALYAYFVDRPPSECPGIEVPLHTVLQLTPTAYGCDERRVELGMPYDAPSS